MSSKLQLENRTFVYVHDPMCSWCWGYKETLAQLIQHLPKDIEPCYLLGGLAADNDSAMPDALQAQIKSNWLRIQQTIPGTEFNFDFWTLCQPRRSTYPACRAVLVARRCDCENEMITAIQEAYYLQARNPSDEQTLSELAEQIGIEKKQFIEQLNSDEINQQLMDEIELARSIGADSFPSLFFYENQQFHPLVLDYNAYETTLEHIMSFVTP